MGNAAEVPFESPYRHGFVRCGVAVPELRIAQPELNAAETLRLARQASDSGAALLVFPELGLSAYTAEDLFHQSVLLEGCEAAIEQIVSASRDIGPVLVFGSPLRAEGKLFNCAIVVHRGRILGVIPKSYLPNYREYYEKRQFTAARAALRGEIAVTGRRVPFGSLLFSARDIPAFSFFVEICEDLWTVIPESSWGALAGATVLCNLSASNITVDKARYRQTLCEGQSGRTIAAYLYAGAGLGESSTDLAWDGHGMIWENAVELASSHRFANTAQLILADVDVERLQGDRLRTTSFQDAIEDHRPRLREIEVVEFEFEPPTRELSLLRPVSRFPYVPSDSEERDERCAEVYEIQVHGLCQRLLATGIDKAVIGVSGGLDSTQALLVAVSAFDRLELPRENILGFSLPGLATSEPTRANAQRLMTSLGVDVGEIDISEPSTAMLERIGHPAAGGKQIYDVTFENVQAGERTSHLFRIANLHGALVVGTGDLSELALGWCTYGVGDHMSHYNVNSSVPKTLIRHLIRWLIDRGDLDEEVNEVLGAILDTAISPELVPASAADGALQSTEEVVGPFELQDFNLYHVTRFGFRPSKVAFLAHCAWGDAASGTWPHTVPAAERSEYSLADIKAWLEVFLLRFFELSQFKRSAMPNGPKVGSGGSLSPRSDWRAPSDSKAALWLEELRQNVPEA